MHSTHRGMRFVVRNGSLSLNRIAMASFSAGQPIDKKVYWRESATVLIAKPGPNSTSKGSVEFLITARSEKAKFMPGGLCFPGGNVSHIDASTEWLDLYTKFGLSEKIKNFSWLEPTAHKPEIYQVDNSSTSNVLPKEVSLRITAIRETFEECGILICKPASASAIKANPATTTVELPEPETVKWQQRVKANPYEFLALCHDLEVVPNLHTLGEWNNWLTPTTFKPSKKGQPRRFDTIFYIVILENSIPPKVVIDPEEVSSYVWSSASKLLDEYGEEMHKLLPPQLYEMGRLRQVNLDELKKLVKLRQQLGIERWCPYVQMTSEGPLGCLPGDDMMPQNQDIYNYTPMETVGQSLEELEKSSKNLNRWQIGSDGIYQLLANHHNHGQKYPSNENIKLARSKVFS